MIFPKYLLSFGSSAYMNDNHVEAVTMRLSGVTISTSISPTDCNAIEVQVIVMADSARV